MYEGVLSTTRFAKRSGCKAEASPNKNSEGFARKLLFPGHSINTEINWANVGNFFPAVPILSQQEKQSVVLHLFQSRAPGLQLMLAWRWGWQTAELSVEHLHREWGTQAVSLISLQTDIVLRNKMSLTESETRPFSWNTLPQWPPDQVTPSLAPHCFRLWRKSHLETAQPYDAKPPSQLASVSRAQLGNTRSPDAVQILVPAWDIIHPLWAKLNCDYEMKIERLWILCDLCLLVWSINALPSTVQYWA